MSSVLTYKQMYTCVLVILKTENDWVIFLITFRHHIAKTRLQLTTKSSLDSAPLPAELWTLLYCQCFRQWWEYCKQRSHSAGQTMWRHPFQLPLVASANMHIEYNASVNLWGFLVCLPQVYKIYHRATQSAFTSPLRVVLKRRPTV